MKFKYIQITEDIYSQYWLYPLMLTTSVLLILATLVSIDWSLQHTSLFSEYKYFRLNIDGVHRLLTMITTTSITIISVTFSITVVTLSLASNQLGPRILPLFIKQGRTQLIIGIFVSAYIYCIILLVLTSNANFISHPIFLSAYFSVVLAIICFFALIYFIHYVCSVIRVDSVLDIIKEDLLSNLDRQFEREEYVPQQYLTIMEKAHFYNLCAPHDGYIQTHDLKSIRSFASEHNFSIEIYHRSGHHVVAGEVLAIVYADQPINEDRAEKFNHYIKIGRQRTTIQDVEYGFDQISEIAVRTLSKGTNNPYTAIQCIHVMTEVFNHLREYNLENNAFTDDSEVVRVKFNPFTYKSIVDIALNQLRQNGCDYVCVTLEFFRMIRILTRNDLPEPMYKALIEQKKKMLESAQQKNHTRTDMDVIMKEYEM